MDFIGNGNLMNKYVQNQLQVTNFERKIKNYILFNTQILK